MRRSGWGPSEKDPHPRAPRRRPTSAIWHNLAQAVLKEVAAHSGCWAKAGPPPNHGPRAQTTRQRWQQVHDLLGQGVGLLDCARRLNLSLNTVKRYARAREPERLVRAPLYRPTLVDPYRDYLKRRHAENPAAPVLHLFHEIKEQGYAGSLNLFVRYLNQGRVDSDRPAISPRRVTRRVTRLLLTRPATLTDSQRDRLNDLTTACPEMITLAGLVHGFAALLHPPTATPTDSTNGSPPPGLLTCPTCIPSPAVSTSTAQPSTPPSPCPTTTAAPKA